MKQLKNILQSNIFFIICIIITCLYTFINIKLINYKSIYKGNECEFIGQITKIKKNNYGYSIILNSKEKLILYTNKFNYNLGDVVLVKGNLEKAKNNAVFNNFNYKKYLYQNKIFYILKADDIKLLKKNTNIIYTIKNNMLNYMNKFKSSNYLKSFILGDTSYLEDDIYNSYQINGICHLLAIGSSHITFLSIILLFIFRKIKLNEIISNILLFILILIFIILTDYPISIIRVYLYMIISFLNKLFKLNYKTIKIFILTLLITLIINPFYLYNKGFLYSYSISFILILNKDKLNSNYIINLLKISFISFLYSIPFNIYFNYSINLLSIIYNLFFVPVFNIIIFPLSLLSCILPIFDNLFYNIMKFLNNISFILNNYTFGIIILKKISIIILIIYILIITCVIHDFLNKNKKGIIVLIIILVIHFNINNLFTNNFIVIIDVGQGDSNLIYLNNKTILIDTGGLYNSLVSEKTITMLKSFGIRKIDYLIITHGDYDHMGDSFNLVNNFKVDKVILNCGELNNLENNLIKVLEKNKISYSFCIEKISIDNNTLHFLNSKIYDNENDNSNVIYIEFNNYKFLFMGDASVEVEEDLIKKYNLKNIDVLKVGHHGSKTSSSKNFVDEINPKYSIISVGKNNRYGHPKKEVLNILCNSKIYRTDQDGSIMFKFKNDKLNIETCIK